MSVSLQITLTDECVCCLHLWCVLLSYRTSFAFVELDIRHDMSACNCVCVCLGGLPTYRDVSPELGHVVVVGAEELGEPADGPLAAFVHCFVSLKVLIVFVD